MDQTSPRPFLLSRVVLAIATTVVALIGALGFATSALLRGGETAAEAYAREAVTSAGAAAVASVNRTFVQVDSVLAGLPDLLGEVVAVHGDAQPERDAAIARLLGASPTPS
ncbi:hypothetical protein ACE7GA_19735 [Roseomonas sp. CCTCC AB2023176]|uniref:hypothetical protein n=1 Tax=Roseomonas sp. CCTCC AB2023176 TaxID=3342640 RepID=UPI0035DF4636